MIVEGTTEESMRSFWELFCNALKKTKKQKLKNNNRDIPVSLLRFYFSVFLSLLKLACAQGQYGNDCMNKCGAGCLSGTCHPQNGYCTCKNTNWRSQMCQVIDEI